jgi:hypothetical protein
MIYPRPNFLKFFNIRDFVLYFCVAYTFFDITGALVVEFNHFGGGIINDKNVSSLVPEPTNNTINLVISVK